jgi:hypothetical protein
MAHGPAQVRPFLSYLPVSFRTVTDPSYRPRDYCRPAAGFGRDAAVSFTGTVTVRGSELDLRQAARFHHEHALRIRTTLAAQGCTLTEYARLSGMNYRRLTRLLGGYIVMQLADIANANRTLTAIVQTQLIEAEGTSNPPG